MAQPLIRRTRDFAAPPPQLPRTLQTLPDFTSTAQLFPPPVSYTTFHPGANIYDPILTTTDTISAVNRVFGTAELLERILDAVAENHSHTLDTDGKPISGNDRNATSSASGPSARRRIALTNTADLRALGQVNRFLRRLVINDIQPHFCMRLACRVPALPNPNRKRQYLAYLCRQAHENNPSAVLHPRLLERDIYSAWLKREASRKLRIEIDDLFAVATTPANEAIALLIHTEIPYVMQEIMEPLTAAREMFNNIYGMATLPRTMLDGITSFVLDFEAWFSLSTDMKRLFSNEKEDLSLESLPYLDHRFAMPLKPGAGICASDLLYSLLEHLGQRSLRRVDIQCSDWRVLARFLPFNNVVHGSLDRVTTLCVPYVLFGTVRYYFQGIRTLILTRRLPQERGDPNIPGLALPIGHHITSFTYTSSDMVWQVIWQYERAMPMLVNLHLKGRTPSLWELGMIIVMVVGHTGVTDLTVPRPITHLLSAVLDSDGKGRNEWVWKTADIAFTFAPLLEYVTVLGRRVRRDFLTNDLYMLRGDVWQLLPPNRAQEGLIMNNRIQNAVPDIDPSVTGVYGPYD